MSVNFRHRQKFNVASREGPPLVNSMRKLQPLLRMCFLPSSSAARALAPVPLRVRARGLLVSPARLTWATGQPSTPTKKAAGCHPVTVYAPTGPTGRAVPMTGETD